MWEPQSRKIGQTNVNTSQLAQGEVLAFICEHYEQQSQLHRQYLIKYYSDSDSIEIVDKTTRKLFLKKSKRPATMNLKDLHRKGRVLVHGRVYLILAYGDAYTESVIQPKREEAFVVCPMGSEMCGVFEAIDRLGMQIKRTNALYENDQLVVAISAVGSDANSKLAAEGIKSRGDLDEQGKTGYFTNTAAFAGTLDNSTCVVIQPSAVAANQTGGILRMIVDQGYEISAMGMFELSEVEANEFHEVYQHVVPTFKAKVAELSSGPCIALEVRAENAVETFRMSAGPWDVDMAKALAPDTIRAKFGMDNSRNAVHCTDLSCDSFDEVNYFFGNQQHSAMLRPLSCVN
jgi:nucleoside-diphosphate kinase